MGDIVNLGDQYIVLNADYTGSTPVADAGLQVERGTLANASILWDESEDMWKAGTLTYETQILVADDNGNNGGTGVINDAASTLITVPPTNG